MPDLVIAAAATKNVNLYDKPSACDLMQVFLKSIITFELTIPSVAIYKTYKKPLLPMTQFQSLLTMLLHSNKF